MGLAVWVQVHFCHLTLWYRHSTSNLSAPMSHVTEGDYWTVCGRDESSCSDWTIKQMEESAHGLKTAKDMVYWKLPMIWFIAVGVDGEAKVVGKQARVQVHMSQGVWQWNFQTGPDGDAELNAVGSGLVKNLKQTDRDSLTTFEKQFINLAATWCYHIGWTDKLAGRG